MKKAELSRQYKAFIKRFWELCERHDFSFSVREFERFSRLLKYQPENFSGGLKTPFTHITVAANGNFSTFCPELLTAKSERFGNFVFGNVLTHTFEDVVETEKFQLIWKEINQGQENCKNSCEYFKVCGGGYATNKHAETGRFDTTETLHCKFQTQHFTDAILDHLEAKYLQTPTPAEDVSLPACA